jgi:hypothetical protein
MIRNPDIRIDAREVTVIRTAAAPGPAPPAPA